MASQLIDINVNGEPAQDSAANLLSHTFTRNCELQRTD